MFISTQPWLKWLAAGFGAMSLLFATPVTVIAEESSNNQVLLAQQSDELERARQQLLQAMEQVRAENFEEAVTLLEQALPVFRQAWGSADTRIPVLEYYLKGAKLSQAGETEEAKAMFEQARVLAEELRKSQNSTSSTPQSSELEEAARLHQQANQLYQQGKYNEAASLAKRFLAIRERILGENHTDVAIGLNQLALIYRSQGRYSEAEPVYLRSLAILEETLGKDNLLVAISLNNIALLYEKQGRYSEAEPLYQRSLTINENVYGENHPEYAVVLNNLAELYRNQGRYSEAEPFYQHALTIFKNTFGENHPDVALVLNNLAALYEKQGRYSEAEPFYQRSLAIHEKLLGVNHPDFARSINNLATLYYRQGRYDQAESLLQRSLSVRQNALGEDHIGIAESLNNLAALYSKQGRYSKAEPYYQRSLEIKEKALGQNHLLVAHSLNNLASLYQSQGRYNKAEPLHQRALAIREKVLGENHPEFAESLNNLAALYQSQRRYDEAETLYLRALAIREKVLGENHPDVALVLNNLAELYRSQGRYSEAEPLYQRSLDILERVLGENHPDVATRLNNLAVFYSSQGDTTQAISFLRRGLDVEEQNLNILLATGSESQKQDSMKTISSTTDYAIYLHIQDSPNNKEAAHLALTTILRRKARILDTVTNELQLIRENIPPENQQLLDELNAVQSQRANLLYNPPDNLPPEQYRQLTENLRAEAEKLEAQLAQRSAEFRVETEPVEIETLQQLIPEDTALVEIIQYKPYDTKAIRWGKPHYAAYILSANSINWVNLGEAEPIDQKVNEFRRDLGEKRSGIERSARELDQIVMQPIRENLGDKTHILISPDGQLNLIPFAALMDENNEYLVKNYMFTYLTTGRDLLRLQLDAPSRQDPVMLANPNYDEPGNSTGVQLASSPPRIEDCTFSPPSKPSVGGTGVENPSFLEAPNVGGLGAEDLGGEENKIPSPPGLGDLGGEDLGGRKDNCTPANRTASKRGINQRSTDFNNLAFGPLKGTQLEADAIKPIVPNLQVFTGSEATENLLEQLQAPSILHIATHGFFLEDIECTPKTGSRGTRDATIEFVPNPDFQPDCKPTPSNLENPLLRSGLALAGFNRRESGDKDGVLTASEVTRLKLYGTKLVVLSACETGVGSVRTGEGVYGLRRAFVKSGAESQLMSLWKVDDYGTSELMSMYYQRLKNGEARSQAMRQVQLEMLEAPFYEHPYYWASFIFTGDWRPMNDEL